MTANDILQHFEMAQGTASKADIRRAWYLADDGGTISPDSAMSLFSDPRKHTYMTLRGALLWLGCVEMDTAEEPE